jgi:protein SCO1/2
MRVEFRTAWSMLILFVLSIFLGISNTTNSFAEDKKAEDFPAVKLKTQDSKVVRFYEDLIKDKIVIINFMYTQCKGICETGTANLVQVQKALGDHLGRDVFIYSITLDPEHDTPEVLKAYAEKHGARPGWTFLTGNAEDITTLRNKLGLSKLTPDLRRKLGLAIKDSKLDADQKQHSGMVLIGYDAFNKWEKVSITSRPDHILEVIERMKPPRTIPKSFAALARTPEGSATVKTIEAKIADGTPTWQPGDISASVGDEVEWKLSSGEHGVRITNWAAVKDHVEVETVQGQQPFDATSGRNADPTDTVGQVLLRLKIKSVPPAPASITFNCIVHGRIMSGKVSVAAASAGASEQR